MQSAISRKFIKRAAVAIVVLLLLAVAAFFLVVPRIADSRLNRIRGTLPTPSDRATKLHQSLEVVDLHADTLLWDRDLLRRNTRGHVDVPRLIDGHVAVQAFTILTKVPRGLNIESNDDQRDLVFWIAIAERWPLATWNAHALDGDLNNIDVFFDHGIRMMAPTHFFDNDIGGSAHGLAKGGLTAKGVEMIKRMQAKSMIVDLAHASDPVIRDVLAISTRPVVVSHTGVKGTCANTRNLSDEQLLRIAKTGGVIGIGFWEQASCGTDAKAIARAIRYTANLVGVEHVALGSDFDGAVTAPFDATGLVAITDALIEQGFSDAEIRLIMGGNTLRVLQEGLPKS